MKVIGLALAVAVASAVQAAQFYNLKPNTVYCETLEAITTDRVYPLGKTTGCLTVPLEYGLVGKPKEVRPGVMEVQMVRDGEVVVRYVKASSITTDRPGGQPYEPVERKKKSTSKHVTKKAAARELTYAKVTGRYGTYTEVLGISESEKRKIFSDMVNYQDRTGDDTGAYSMAAQRYGIPTRAAKCIVDEGLSNGWPMPPP
jgi:hypothetical protein